MRDLFLLATLPRQEALPDVERLCLMKISKDANSYIAATSEDVGRQLITGRRLTGYCNLLKLSELTPTEIEKTRSAGMMLFDRSEQVADYLEKGERFNFQTLLVSLRDAEQRLNLGS